MSINIGSLNYPFIAASIHDGHKIREELQEFLFIEDSAGLGRKIHIQLFGFYQ